MICAIVAEDIEENNTCHSEQKWRGENFPSTLRTRQHASLKLPQALDEWQAYEPQL